MSPLALLVSIVFMSEKRSSGGEAQASTVPRHEAFWHCSGLAGSEPGAELCQNCRARGTETCGSRVPLGSGCCVMCCPCPCCPSIPIPTQLGVASQRSWWAPEPSGGLFAAVCPALRGCCWPGVPTGGGVALSLWGRVPDMSQGAGLGPWDEAQSSVGGTQLTLSPPMCFAGPEPRAGGVK